MHAGMSWSGFRPSDDEQRYGACKQEQPCALSNSACMHVGYLVPSNMFAVAALRMLEEMAKG